MSAADGVMQLNWKSIIGTMRLSSDEKHILLKQCLDENSSAQFTVFAYSKERKRQ